MFTISETDTYRASVKKPELKRYAKKVSEQVYPVLRTNPYFGTNIKKQKGDLSDIYRYRIGTFRLFYIVIESERRVVILSLRDRKDAY